jgi:hypothetical protein
MSNSGMGNLTQAQTSIVPWPATTVLKASDKIRSSINASGASVEGKLVQYYFEKVFTKMKNSTLEQKSSIKEK